MRNEWDAKLSQERAMNAPTVSLVTLTYNRRETMRDALQTLCVAGYPIAETIWVDNGSTDGTVDLATYFMHNRPGTCILFHDNQGCAKGFNAAFRIAQSEWVAVPGSDMLFPENWLAEMMQYVEAFPDVDLWSTLFNLAPEHYAAIVEERRLGADVSNGTLTYTPALCIGPMLIRRSLFGEIGYLPEDGSLYGYEDVNFARRCKKHGKKTGLIQSIIPKHLGEQDVTRYPDYFAWKAEQVAQADNG